MRPCPSGPQKHGYSINLPPQDLVKLAPALILGLKLFVVAAGVAGGAAGLKFPLPSFASIDALKSTLKMTQKLVAPTLSGRRCQLVRDFGV